MDFEALTGITPTDDERQLLQLYSRCTLCPNRCAVDRLSGEKGLCASTAVPLISFCGLHRGEEPPVSGKNGAGMIFFNGCSLHCRYCQNSQISLSGTDSPGVPADIPTLVSLMLALQEQGAHCLNLVTSSHFLPTVMIALKRARRQGLKLPVVYNTSGFETVEALRLIDPLVDLYLIDVKTLDKSVSDVFCGGPDYPDAIVSAMEYLRSTHPRTFMRKGHLYGILVRHLVFPGTLEATMSFLDWYAARYKDRCYLSLMVQFVPPDGDTTLPELTRSQYDTLMRRLDELEIDNGFYQEYGEDAGFEAERMWIPDFNRDQPFAPGFADPLPLFLNLRKNSRRN